MKNSAVKLTLILTVMLISIGFIEINAKQPAAGGGEDVIL